MTASIEIIVQYCFIYKCTIPKEKTGWLKVFQSNVSESSEYLFVGMNNLLCSFREWSGALSFSISDPLLWEFLWISPLSFVVRYIEKKKHPHTSVSSPTSCRAAQSHLRMCQRRRGRDGSVCLSCRQARWQRGRSSHCRSTSLFGFTGKRSRRSQWNNETVVSVNVVPSVGGEAWRGFPGLTLNGLVE